MDDNDGSTRRRFLRCVGGACAALGLAGRGAAQEQEVTETFRLMGLRSGWEGVAPDGIAGEKNPLLRFEEVGARYRVEWENGDGLPHNFVIQDADKNDIAGTDLVSEEGATASVEFEATEEMARYQCDPHSGAMNGDVALGPPDQYADLKQEVDVALEATADGWVGITPSTIEGETNPTIEFTEGQSYDVAIVRNVARDDLNLAFVDESGEVLVGSQTLNDHNTEEQFTVEASTAMVRYLAEAEPETFSGEVAVEPDPGAGRDAAIEELTAQADFVLDGITGGWEGIAPSGIEGETNPALELEAGETYTVGWINGDGAPHNIAVQDGDEERLVGTEIIEEEAATQTLEFEATGEMVRYLCEVHPTTMVGDLAVAGGETTPEPTTEPPDTEPPTTDTTAEESPGFGVVASLAALGAGGAAALRRLAGDE